LKRCLAKKVGRSFFSEEKKQKTFIFRRSNDRGHCSDLAAGARIKVFLLLFLQKKKTFLSCCFRPA